MTLFLPSRTREEGGIKHVFPGIRNKCYPQKTIAILKKTRAPPMGLLIRVADHNKLFYSVKTVCFSG